MISSLRRRGGAVGALAAATLLLASCSSGGDDTGDDATSPADDGAPAAEEGEWPRTITNEVNDTEAEIPAQPERIVSTSITLTGTLLAIDAPVVASAATGVSPLTDDKGFFSQWADVADERGVEVAYPDLELDLDAVDSFEPDLIVVSSLGADTAIDAYDQLSEIAPTIVLDYGSHSWEELAGVLGEATGLEEGAEAAVADFDDYVADAAEQITLPEQPASAYTYNGPDGGNIFSETSPQASILTGLGFEYNPGDAELSNDSMDGSSGARTDITAYTQENLPLALADSQTSILISATDENADALKQDPLFAETPSVASGSVVAVGMTSFRIDYYSGKEMVDALVAAYGA